MPSGLASSHAAAASRELKKCPRQPSTPAPLIRELAELGFLARAENLVLVGAPGTGKSHLGIAIGIRACSAHKRVLFRSVAELLDELIAATVEHTLGARLAMLGRLDLLILDELGYLPIGSAARESLLPTRQSALRARFDHLDDQ